jgi:hypothetical protein
MDIPSKSDEFDREASAVPSRGARAEPIPPAERSDEMVFSLIESRVANDPCSWCIVDNDDPSGRGLDVKPRGEATWTTNGRYGA